MASTEFTNTQNQQVTISITRPNGSPVKLESAPTWTVKDESIIDLKVSDDGMSAVMVSKGNVGSTPVTVTAVFNGQTTEDTFQVTVNESGEIVFVFTFSKPEHQ